MSMRDILDQEMMFEAIDRSLAMIAFNVQGKILWANNNFAEVIGYTTAELVRMEHRNLCLPSFANSREYHSFWDDLRHNRAYHQKVERLAKNGDVLWLDAFYTPVVNGSGQVEGVIKIATDITSREDTLIHSKSEFLRSVSDMTESTDQVHDASRNAVVEMSRLDEESRIVKESTERIQSMAAIVKEIATQSHLLGLNASIEAARAGEHGRGFSVVAQEVRKMATTSHDAARDISNQLTDILKSITVMAEKVEMVKDLINENSESIDNLKQAYGRIANTAEELSDII